jgi:hypothetical protein
MSNHKRKKMSWDIVLFHSRQTILNADDIDDTQLAPCDFDAALEAHFQNIVKDGNHREIKGTDYSIDYFTDDEPVSNKLLSLYGENALFELIVLAGKHRWQIYDSGLDDMIDLENPEANGYSGFQEYLRHVIDRNS